MANQLEERIEPVLGLKLQENNMILEKGVMGREWFETEANELI